MKPGIRSAETLADVVEDPHSPHHRHVFVPRWAVVSGFLATGLLYLALPQELRFGPSWLLLAVEALLLIPLMISWITGRPIKERTIRLLVRTLLAFITLGLAIGVAFLVRQISLPAFKHAGTLLISGGLLWCSNILVFSLWYWEIDGGGPHQRMHAGHRAADFMFPQQVDGNTGGWAPDFIDYLFVAFTTSTALSPTDTYPLTHKAKGLMMIQALLAAVILVLLIGRAVNILGS
jgi:hypothetical protein